MIRRVDVARHLQREQVGRVLGVVEDVGGRLVDRYRAGARGRIRLLARVQRQGLRSIIAHFVLLPFHTWNSSRERKKASVPEALLAPAGVAGAPLSIFPLLGPGRSVLAAGIRTWRAGAPVAAASKGQIPRPLVMVNGFRSVATALSGSTLPAPARAETRAGTGSYLTGSNGPTLIRTGPFPLMQEAPPTRPVAANSFPRCPGSARETFSAVSGPPHQLMN